MPYIILPFLFLSLLWSKTDPSWGFFGILEPEKGFGPSYYDIRDVKKRKERFMDILYPLVIEGHNRIQQDRAFAIAYFKKREKGQLTDADTKKMALLNKKYRIQKSDRVDEYLLKIDIVPAALVLAQAAAESAWGNSRFAKEANNIFGEWTWGLRGIIPSGRPAGKKYMIRIFNTLQDSVDAYMLNLNRHHAYKNFRKARFAKRSKGKCFKGKEATHYLQNYSAIGDEYQKMLKGIIHYNKMCEYSLLQESMQLN